MSSVLPAGSHPFSAPHVRRFTTMLIEPGVFLRDRARFSAPLKGQLTILLPQPEVDYIVLNGDYYMFPRSHGIVLGGSRGRGDGSTSIDPVISTKIIETHQSIFKRVPPLGG